MWTEVGDEIMNKKYVVRDLKYVVSIFIIALLIVCLLIGLLTYICTHNENYLYYGNDNYCFVTIQVGSGRSSDIYDGVITVDDYKRWLDGKEGTIFVNSVTNKNYGITVSIANITTIDNKGSKPKWLPLNFGF